MAYRESRPLTPTGARPAAEVGGLTRTGSPPRQNSTPARSPLDSDHALPSFVRKAAAVLDDELKGISSLGTEVLREAPSSGPLVIEPTAERFRQQVSELVDAFIQILEHQPGHVTRFTSQGAGVGRTHSGDDPQSVPLLKPPPPVNFRPSRMPCLKPGKRRPG